ncbi:Glutamate receptor 4-like 4, partial [Homarus americanus]
TEFLLGTRSFAWQVWVTLLLVIAASVVLGVFANWVTERWRLPGTQGVKEGYVFRPSWLLRALLLEPVDRLPTSLTGRVLLGAWLVAGLILGSAYQGVLTSLLAVPRVAVPVDSLQNLVDYGRLPWSVEYGTALHQLFGDAKSGIQKKIHEGAFLVTSLFEEKERIKTERFALLCDFFSMKQVMSDDYSATGTCNYYIASEVIWACPMAFTFTKGSPIVQHFNKWLMMMRESGLVNRYLDELTSNATLCMLPPGKERGIITLVLSLTDLAGIFLLLVVGLAVSTIILAVEKLVHLF